MSLSDLASLGSFIGGIAVPISLVFLYFQVRQVNAQAELAAKHTRAQIWQSATHGGADLFLAMMNTDMCATHIIENGGTVTPETVRQRQFFLQTFALYQMSIADIYQQWEDGLLTDTRLDRVKRQVMAQLRMEPGTRRTLAAIIAGNTAPEDKFNHFLQRMIEEAGQEHSGGKNA